ncbi:neuromedin-U receptor 2 [Biomphalaria glabrata]|nr:neuromedin-U receptor 2-like [Biomphalaria glabrata]
MAASDDENLTTTTMRALSPHTSPNTTMELIAILERLSPQRVLENVPAMIFVSFLMFIGVIGKRPRGVRLQAPLPEDALQLLHPDHGHL